MGCIHTGLLEWLTDTNNIPSGAYKAVGEIAVRTRELSEEK